MTDIVYKKLIAKLRKRKILFVENLRFCQLTTIGCGGKIRLTVYPNNVKQLAQTARYLQRRKINYFVLGNGSNVVASDDFFDGVVIATKNVVGVWRRGNVITATCGIKTAKLGNLLQKLGLSNGEFLCCIPATVGGAVYGNAGCYEQDVSQILRKVCVLQGNKIRILTNKRCCFSKRNSTIKQKAMLVLWAQFCFDTSTPQQVAQKIALFKQQKNATQPLGQKSAGSVLYHKDISLAPLLDNLGLKGYCVGGAQISPKHAGFVLNVDKATSKDIYLLIQYMQKALLDGYDVTAQTEVVLFNFTKEQA